ncbi:MAG: response regulator [Bacteroidetes bacterium]|nr:response regulator [Fibrella sp.]
MALAPNRHCEVILIDDDEDEFYLLNYALKNYSDHITLHQYRQAQEITHHLETAATLPSLVLVDMHMPVLSGVDLLHFIKSHDGLKNIPVVVWSGDMQPDEVNQCYEAGAASVIMKSTGREQMAESITNLCNYWFVTVHLPIYAKQANC